MKIRNRQVVSTVFGLAPGFWAAVLYRATDFSASAQRLIEQRTRKATNSPHDRARQASKTIHGATRGQFIKHCFPIHLESVDAAPTTIKAYSLAVSQLGDYLRQEGLPTDPRKVKREHLTGWMLHLQRPPHAGGRGLAAQTALQRYQSIRQFFKFPEESADIKESPMAKMKPPRVPEKLVPVIAAGDMKKLFKAVSGTDFESRRDKAIFSVFIDVGIRVSEMAGLSVEDLDLDSRDITVMGKGRRPRVMRIVKETRTDLLRYLEVRSRHPYAADSALWVGKRGRMTDNGIRQLVRRPTLRRHWVLFGPTRFLRLFGN